MKKGVGKNLKFSYLNLLFLHNRPDYFLHVLNRTVTVFINILKISNYTVTSDRSNMEIKNRITIPKDSFT